MFTGHALIDMCIHILVGYLLIGLFGLLFSSLSSLSSLGISPVKYPAIKEPFPFCGLSLHSVVSFAVLKLFSLMKPYWTIVSIISWVTGVPFRKSLMGQWNDPVGKDTDLMSAWWHELDLVGPTWWKERNDSHKLSCDICTCAWQVSPPTLNTQNLKNHNKVLARADLEVSSLILPPMHSGVQILHSSF